MQNTSCWSSIYIHIRVYYNLVNIFDFLFGTSLLVTQHSAILYEVFHYFILKNFSKNDSYDVFKSSSRIHIIYLGEKSAFSLNCTILFGIYWKFNMMQTILSFWRKNCLARKQWILLRLLYRCHLKTFKGSLWW